MVNTEDDLSKTLSFRLGRKQAKVYESHNKIRDFISFQAHLLQFLKDNIPDFCLPCKVELDDNDYNGVFPMLICMDEETGQLYMAYEESNLYTVEFRKFKQIKKYFVDDLQCLESPIMSALNSDNMQVFIENLKPVFY